MIFYIQFGLICLVLFVWVTLFCNFNGHRQIVSGPRDLEGAMGFYVYTMNPISLRSRIPLSRHYAAQGVEIILIVTINVVVGNYFLLNTNACVCTLEFRLAFNEVGIKPIINISCVREKNVQQKEKQKNRFSLCCPSKLVLCKRKRVERIFS